MEQEILELIKTNIEKGLCSALVSVTSVNGATPSSVGDLMLVNEDGSILGTIGGGKLEFDAIKTALLCIKESKDTEKEYNLTPDSSIAMECGGFTRIYIKIFKPKPKLVIAGGGHIGLELYKLGILMDFEVDIFEDRAEFCNRERFPLAKNLFLGKYGETIDKYISHKNSFICIVTSGHKGDGECLKAFLNKEYKYLGMIGSTRKVRKIYSEVEEELSDKSILKQLNAPMGLNAGSNEPREIALGIMMEIIMKKNNAELIHMKTLKMGDFYD